MKQTVSLVLSSGGARGLAHIGVIEELQRQGFEIKSVSGTSMGSMVGGLYASGNLDGCKSWFSYLDKKSIFNLADFTISTDGFVKGDKIINELKKIVPDVNIEDLSISFTAVATDIKNKKEVVFDKGSLFEAIRASISIPTVFIPFKLGEMVLIDGAVLNPIPINCVKRRENDLLIAVDVNSSILEEDKSSVIIDSKSVKVESNPLSLIKNGTYLLQKINIKQFNYYSLLSQSASLMLQQISSMTIETYKPDIVIKIPINSYSSFHYNKYDKIIESGRAATQRAIAEYDARALLFK